MYIEVRDGAVETLLVCKRRREENVGEPNSAKAEENKLKDVLLNRDVSITGIFHQLTMLEETLAVMETDIDRI